MSNTILLPAAAGVAAGVLSALAATTFFAPSAPPATAGAVDAKVNLELASLREENGRLAERLRALESRPLGAPREARTAIEPAGAPQALTREDLTHELQQLVAAMRNPDVLPPDNFVPVVKSAIETIREEERRAEEAERAAERAQRLEERLAQLQLELGLSSDQTHRMRDALSSRDSAFAQMRETMRDGDFGNVRENFQRLREESEKTIGQILSPDQYAKYQESDPFNGGRGGWGRFGGEDAGRGRRPGGGGGGGF